ncbi:Uncharacterised protein [Vibrio cholerae]|nr:Uncharacterised protein [Vibrio cholerae]
MPTLTTCRSHDLHHWPVIQAWRFAPLARRSSHLTG